MSQDTLVISASILYGKATWGFLALECRRRPETLGSHRRTQVDGAGTLLLWQPFARAWIYGVVQDVVCHCMLSYSKTGLGFHLNFPHLRAVTPPAYDMYGILRDSKRNLVQFKQATTFELCCEIKAQVAWVICYVPVSTSSKR